MLPLHRRDGFTLIELMIVVVILGLLAAIAIPNFLNFTDRARMASVKSNCHTTQLVCEDFAIRNDGIYPMTTGDAAADGSTMITLLPAGQRLMNPFTAANTEPVDGAAATIGQTGYLPNLQAGIPAGYTIEGFGKSALVITLTTG
jgi:prepilin-type N-terminal cleavage/methylation domain-containing protein